MSGIPALTGDSRTDRALATLAKLLYEITGNGATNNQVIKHVGERGGIGQEQQTTDKECTHCQYPPRPPPVLCHDNT